MIIAITLALVASMAAADSPTGKAVTVSLVNQDPSPAVAGEVVDIRLGVQNMGSGTAQNMVLEFVPEYPFQAVSGLNTIQKLDTIQPFQADINTQIVKFSVRVDKDASAGTYEFKVLQYQDGMREQSAIERTFNIDVKSKANAEVIHIDKTTLVPGKLSNLTFVINNVGNSPLKDLTFYWENSDDAILPVGSDNTRYIKYLDIGKSAEIHYQVIPDTNAAAGLYKLNLYLTYEDSLTADSTTISTIAGVYVGGGTDFDVAFSENANGQMSFSIANIGSNPASSVSVIIPQQKAWRVTGSNSMIIGNLNKGDYTVASFNLQSASIGGTMNSQNRTMGRNFSSDGQTMPSQPASADSANTVLMQIAYTDTMGERQLVEKEVNIGFQNIGANATSFSGVAGARGARQQQSFFSQYQWYIIGLVVIIALFIVYRRYQKRKLLNPETKMKDIFSSKKK